MKTFDDTNSQNFTPTDEVEMFNNGPDSPEEAVSDRAVKGAAWLLGIVGIFGVAILLAWIVGMHNSPLSSRGGADRPATAMRATRPAVNPQATTTPAQFVAILVPASAQTGNLKGATDASKALPSNPQPAALKATATETSAASTQAYNDRIEREAREVIHGDFGNNPGRKAKLGADYAAVQARVNQLLHI